MTLALSWKCGEVVYFAADAAVTSLAEEGAPSTFGEQAPNVTEAATKIVKLTDRCVASVIGSPKEASLFLQQLRGCVDSLPIGESVARAFQATLPVRDETQEYIVHLGVQKGIRTELFRISSANPGSLGVPALGYLLDGPVAQSRVFYERCGRLLATVEKWDSPRQLHAVLAMLQSFSIRRGMFYRGVGGMYSGASLDANGVHWPHDSLMLFGLDPDRMMYTLFESADGKDSGWEGDLPRVGLPARRIVREGVVYSQSAIQAGRYRIMYPLLMDESEKAAWNNRWSASVLALGRLWMHRFTYLFNENKTALVDESVDPKYINYVQKQGGLMTLAIRKDVMDALAGSADDGRPATQWFY